MKRLSPAFLTMLMLLVVGGLVVMYVGKRLLAKPEVAKEQTITVPMAVQDLPVGTVITEAHLAKGRILPSKLEAEHALTNGPLLGRVVKNPISHAQPIKSTDLFLVGEYPSLGLEAGMEALTLPTGAGTATVDGIVKVGDRVNIQFTPSSAPDLNMTGGYTMLLMKGIKVVGLNRGMAAAGSRGRNGSMTLEVSPEQGRILLLCKDKGQLAMTYTNEMTNSGKIVLKDADKATLAEILNVDPPEKRTPPIVTELYSGAGRRLQTFKDGMRADRYGIERYDYNRANAGPWGYGGYGYGGYDTEPNGNASGARVEPSVYSGGYFSVPAGFGGAQGAGANGQNGNNNGFGNAGGSQGGFGGAATPEGR